MALPTISFKQAKYYYTGRTKKVRCLTIHTLEYPEGVKGAEWAQSYFATSVERPASTHYTVDSDTITQSVKEADTAFCTPGVNADGISIESGGYAGQTSLQWTDDASTKTLDLMAQLAADICKRNDIPIVHLTNAQLKLGWRGIIGHVQASEVYKGSDHWDPGPNFPWERFIALVKKYAGIKPAPPKVVYADTPFNKYLSEDDRKTLQKRLGVVADADFAANSIKALQRKLRVTVTGVANKPTVSAMQRYLNAINAVTSYKVFAKLGVDGNFGPTTGKALTNYIGRNGSFK